MAITYTRTDLEEAGAHFFLSEGIECAIADGYGEYLGFVMDGERAELVDQGWSRLAVGGSAARHGASRSTRRGPTP